MDSFSSGAEPAGTLGARREPARACAAPQEITRSDRQRSVTVFGNLDGKPLGRAIQEAREVAAAILPEGVSQVP